ncbi:hypothetical protein RCL1_006141 [Eukaryota sp. TZLM3-RCL]
MSLEVRSLCDFYINNEPDPSMRAQIEDLVLSESWSVLESRMTPRLSFGTAGLRGRMEGGFSRMNQLVIIQTTQGLVSYLEQTSPDLLKSGGIVLGFDGRHHSQAFAFAAASVIIGRGYPCHFLHDLAVTPLIPFGVTLYKAAAGIMVTASHNPKEDNGYKVYWSNGCQIIPPHDSGIQNAILSNLAIWSSNVDVNSIKSNPLLIDSYADLVGTYMKEISEKVSKSKDQNATSPLRITYTAMHGTGYKYAVLATQAANLPPLIPVECQVIPDPEFPTVEFPNPEEGKGALLEATKTADAHNSSLILAHDPDADRLAAAEKQQDGQWRVYTGNEIGSIIGWWVYKQWKETKKSNSKAAMLASTVSSKFLGAMAKKEGFLFDETLTGFKWLGHRMIELENEGYDVLLAFEQAIGFATGLVKDKDGVTALVVFSELAAYLYRNGSSINQKLEELNQEYGYFVSRDGYFICHDQEIIDEIFERIRNGGKYLDLQGYPVSRIRDLTGKGLDTAFEDKQPRLPTSSSHMITWTFENGAVITLRTSGTEPKVKYYSEMPAATREEAKQQLTVMVDKLLKEWVQPEKYNLPQRE